MSAQCDSGWNWSSNSLGQNPCEIAGTLESPCRGLASYVLGPLNDSNYIAPQKGSALPCECNTVMYSLFMACTACQGEQLETWNFWAQNCDAVYITQYPLDIPPAAAVPHWAYLNVTANGTWSQTDSLAVVGQPESTGVGPPTSSLPASTGSSNTVTTTGNTATNTSSNSSGGGSNVGAIAGGVVGGLAGLGILTALVVWYIMKRKRSQVAPSSAYMNSSQPPNKFNPPNYEPPLTPSAPPSPMRMTYNPSDPSTFPTAFHDPSIGTNSAYPQTLYDPNAARMGRYSGAPEI